MPPPGGTAARLQRVHWYREETGGETRWLLDGEDERVEKLYDAWPRRLVIVDANGRVAFDAGHGIKKPWDVREIERQLRAGGAAGDLH